MSSMIVKAPAKINLGLAVLKRRPDGFHDLVSVMQQISLSDTLIIRPARKPEIVFACSERSLEGEDNLVYRAAMLLSSQTKKKLPGVRIDLYKHIPIQAGLAGGSSDAAAALRSLNVYWQLGLSFEALSQLGARLGSDIPFCLHGGTALAMGRGEELQALPDFPFFWIVLAVPAGMSLSTASVFAAFNPDSGLDRPPVDRLVSAVRSGNRAALTGWLASGSTNSLEEAAVASCPGLIELKSRFKEMGLIPAMSGSGPAFFSLADNVHHAAAAARILQEEGHRTFLCWPVNRV